MNKFKILFCLFIAILMIVTAITPAFAHSGRTDSNGGHWDHSNGTYHYHNSGNASSSGASSNSSSNHSYDDFDETSSSDYGCDSFFSVLGSVIAAIMFIIIVVIIIVIFKSFFN